MYANVFQLYSIKFMISLVPFDTKTKQLRLAPIIEAVRDDWKRFGIYLGIPDHKLQEIETSTCMFQTLHDWIALKSQEATIHNLISALRGPIIKNESLAQSIESDQQIKEIYEFGYSSSTGGCVITVTVACRFLNQDLSTSRLSTYCKSSRCHIPLISAHVLNVLFRLR